jgi:hypothetical protein
MSGTRAWMAEIRNAYRLLVWRSNKGREVSIKMNQGGLM